MKLKSGQWFSFAVLFMMMLLPVVEITAQVKSVDDVRRVTLDVKKLSLPDILAEIEKQTGITFSYESSLLKELPKTSFKAENETVTDCLTRLLASYPVVYKMTGHIVVLKRKPRQVTISGFVRDQTSAESLAGASVYEKNGSRGAATNNFGFFSLTLAASDDPLRLYASYIGYESMLFDLPSLNRDTVLIVALQPNALLAEVQVTGAGRSSQPTVRNTQMGALDVNQATIRATPALFGESDIIRTLQLTPGVSAGTEGISGLYVRGGNVDENLFLIDGNPVYQLNHLGGIFSAFNAEAIKSMNFYKAGFPARYGGRLSSVVDVQTREGNMREFHGSASLGLIAGNLSLEGPIIKDRTSFSIALRRTWLDALSAPALAIYNKLNKKNGMRLNGRYAFHDLNARVDHRLNDKSRMFVSLYNGNDLLKISSDEFERGYESKDYSGMNSNMRWGNLIASAGWTYAFSSRLFGKVSGFYTRYNSKISYQSNSKIYEGTDNYKHTLEETVNTSSITDIGVRASFDYQAVNHYIRFGGEYVTHRFLPEYNQMKVLDSDKPDSMQIGQLFNGQRRLANELSVYAEDDWTLSPSLRLNGGLRFSLFNIEGTTYTGIEPRLSVRWLLSHNFSIKASYARMKQYVHLLSNSYLNLPTDSWMPVTSRLKPLVSDQLSLGAYYDWKDRLCFSFEAYYKHSNNLLEYKDGYSLAPSNVAWENKMAAGSGRSYGLEWMVRKTSGRTTGWIGYALAWSDRRFDEINNGIRYPSRYDNRHKLNIVVLHKLSSRVELSAAWTYTSGNYTTLSLESYDGLTLSSLPGQQGSGRKDEFDYFSQRNNYQLPSYHRLDLGINIYRPKRNGRMGIWNVSLYNAYCRMNPVMVHKTSEYSDSLKESYPVFKQFGVMPIVPSVSYTYKF